jgi:hypothetical protein
VVVHEVRLASVSVMHSINFTAVKFIDLRICSANMLVMISQWPRGLRCVSMAASLLGLRVRIPAGTWMSVSCECRVLSGRCLCVALITQCGVSECDRKAWITKKPCSTMGCGAMEKKVIAMMYTIVRIRLIFVRLVFYSCCIAAC